MGQNRSTLSVLVGDPEAKILFVRPRHRWEDNNKIGLKLAGRAWTALMWLIMGTSGMFL
jgi:hypothetical protein